MVNSVQAEPPDPDMLQNLNGAILEAIDEDESASQALPDSIPDPREVMRKSAILPGWGQVVNQQTWKVPLVYGLIGGMAYYSYWVDQRYRDYRAAAYNTEYEDEKYGPTPDYLQEGFDPRTLREQRNFLRNRRDLTFLLIVAAYGLNVVDAYVFAHFRDFDVSDDLSANFDVDHFRAVSGNSGFTFTFSLNF